MISVCVAKLFEYVVCNIFRCQENFFTAVQYNSSFSMQIEACLMNIVARVFQCSVGIQCGIWKGIGR